MSSDTFRSGDLRSNNVKRPKKTLALQLGNSQLCSSVALYQGEKDSIELAKAGSSTANQKWPALKLGHNFVAYHAIGKHLGHEIT